MPQFFVRIGALGEIRLARALAPLQRGQRVVVRSPRGIELAEVVSQRQNEGEIAGGDASAYRILRPTSTTDELLISRLARYKRDAIETCRERLRQLGSEVTLLDVDQLLDGGTLLMHFLGTLDDAAQEIAGEIAQKYESIVRTNHLSELLREGCGPECGTTAGCGSQGACGGCNGCG